MPPHASSTLGELRHAYSAVMSMYAFQYTVATVDTVETVSIYIYILIHVSRYPYRGILTLYSY